MKCNYITIEREYGCGGTEIARRLAEKCGIPCYGQEILEAVSRKNHVLVESIQHCEETVSGSFLYTLFMMSKSGAGDPDMLTKEGHIFLDEQREIERMAAKGPAIFLGHCAAEALKDYPGVARVFIRAEREAKRQRIIQEYEIPEQQADAVRKRFDNKRSRYYYANTARKWTNPENYDLILDSSRLGINRCVKILSGLLSEEE